MLKFLRKILRHLRKSTYMIIISTVNFVWDIQWSYYIWYHCQTRIAKYQIYWTHSKNEYHISRFCNTTNGISKGIYYQDQDYENKITQECHTNYDSKTYLAINYSLLNGWFTQTVFFVVQRYGDLNLNHPYQNIK